MQGALPAMLKNTPESFFENTRQLLSANADIAMRVLSAAPGLRPVRPHGAMYITVCVQRGAFAGSFGPNYDTDDEMAMVKALISEQSVYCLPGECRRWRFVENIARLQARHSHTTTRSV